MHSGDDPRLACLARVQVVLRVLCADGWPQLSTQCRTTEARRSSAGRVSGVRIVSSVSGRPTIKEVAERAGVSIATVSRALNDKGDVSAETRDHVRAVARSVGYSADP